MISKGHVPRKAFTEEEVEELAKAALEFTSAELAEKTGKNVSTVRKYLAQMGIRAANYCKLCGRNYPAEEFEGSSNHTRCNRHGEYTGVKYSTERENIESEQADLRKMMKLSRLWLATEEGAPNGPYPTYEETYRS